MFIPWPNTNSNTRNTNIAAWPTIGPAIVFTVPEIAAKYGVGGNDLDEVVAKIINKSAKTEFEKVKDEVTSGKPERNLLEESESIANLRKYHMALQNIKISGELTEQIRKHLKLCGI